MKAIEFENVTFRYEEDSPFVIQKLNFSVEEGEFVAVLGHNGSGKSTLARLSNGLLVPDAGAVRVFRNSASPSRAFWRSSRASSSSTNPPPCSIRAAGARSWTW